MSNLIRHLATGGIMITGIIIGVIVIWRMLEDRKSGFPAQDERTKKLNGKAAMYAFTLGIISC